MLITDEGTYLAEKPSYQVPEDDGIGCFVVARRGRNRGNVPQIGLPLVCVFVGSFDVDEEDPWCALDQPSPIEDADATVSHGLNGGGKFRDIGLELLDFHSGLRLLALVRVPALRRRWEPTYGLVVEGPDQGVTLAIFGGGDGSFRLEDRVDTANCSTGFEC